MEGDVSIECPCCGCNAAREGAWISDGDLLACGCAGIFSVDEEGGHVSLFDEPCPPDAECSIYGEDQ